VITPVLELHSSIDMNQLIYVFMLFYFINLSNLLIFSYFDNELDKKDNITTIVHFFGLVKLRGLIYSGIALSFIILTISYMNEEINEVSFYVFLSMQVTLMGIIIFPSFFGTNERYRFFGDLIYLYPIAIFPFLC
jgi:4-hydroxybenzoate polyprenyltransferase